MKIPRHNLEMVVSIGVGMGLLYMFATPDYGPDGLEGVLEKRRAQMGFKPADREAYNAQLKEVLMRSKQGEFDATVSSTWRKDEGASNAPSEAEESSTSAAA
mmetsp:Transcript_11523/g.20420  ORF Transcript_11523/g.20420 Transcript_11523/m.20420 type:complete len:102 (+) Transcript_11523:217-522(+)